jgi:hypothetical protein
VFNLSRKAVRQAFNELADVLNTEDVKGVVLIYVTEEGQVGTLNTLPDIEAFGALEFARANIHVEAIEDEECDYR